MVISHLRRSFLRAEGKAEMSRLILTLCAAILSAAFSSPVLAQTPPAANPPAQAPAPAPATPPAVTPADPFGAEVTLAPKTFVYMKGTATWETAYDTLVDAFKT